MDRTGKEMDMELRKETLTLVIKLFYYSCRWSWRSEAFWVSPEEPVVMVYGIHYGPPYKRISPEMMRRILLEETYLYRYDEEYSSKFLDPTISFQVSVPRDEFLEHLGKVKKTVDAIMESYERSVS